MNNVHPIYEIKALMVKRELKNDEKLKNENWQRFLPPVKQRRVSQYIQFELRLCFQEENTRNVKQAKKKKKDKWNKKKEYTPFPPPQPRSKIDKMLETGEYFVEKHKNRKRKN